MDKRAKVLTFENEIKWIKSKGIRKFAIEVVSELPDYFFTVAASSTGKYHPDYSLGEGGLVRHTKAAMLIAKTLLDLEQYKNKYNEEERDIMLTALLLHDGVKHGIEGGKYSVASHPTDMNYFIYEMYKGKQLPCYYIEEITGCIATHMGEWVTDWKTKEVILDKPETDMQKFVHMCDFLASRKFLEVNFEKVEY